MLDELIASATATLTPAPASPHDAYAWWSDIWLPLIVGAGSIFIATVAVRVANRSNRHAAAAIRAAAKSNALAERAIRQEEKRTADARAEAARQERRRLGERFLVHIDETAEELQKDPQLWSRPAAAVGDNALFRMTPMIFEAITRGWSDFPGDKAIELMRSGAEAGGDSRRMQLVRNAAHTIVNYWIEDPLLYGTMLETIQKDTAERIA